MAVPADVVTGETIASEWGNDIRDWAALGEVDNSTEVAAVALTASMADVASVSLSIPVEWLAWSCAVYASWGAGEAAGSGAYHYLIRIDGTDQQDNVSTLGAILATGNSVGGRRTGMVTTGSRTVSVRMQETSGQVTVSDIYLYARAVRTA